MMFNSLVMPTVLLTTGESGNSGQFIDYIIASLRLSVPLALTALGGLWSERSGVINIGLEGMLLSGAFAGAVGALWTGNALVGIVYAIIAGGIVGLLHAYLCVTLRVNQLVSGLAINLLAVGLTSFLVRVLFGEGTTPRLPDLPILKIPVLQSIPVIGAILFQQDVIVYSLILLIVFSTYILYSTGHGLALRAVGDYPKAADASGVNVLRVRYISVIASGCLAGLGGAYLTLGHVKFFTENISAGKGFIALAALIFGRWNPVATALSCLLFGAGDALQLRIQALSADIPYQFLTLLPYAIALMALVGLAGQSMPPAALGIPYVKEESGK
jgi:general nucleoside transport system permease protein